MNFNQNVFEVRNKLECEHNLVFDLQYHSYKS